ncbi:MAG: coproporphyrinogen III oxidase family protein [Acidobacteria bacterium]|nr:coproporphyrinogen III oxidase family protein [Acidobacteriota bacterium]
MLRRRRHPEAEAARAPEGREEAHEAGGERADSPVGLCRRIEVESGGVTERPDSTSLSPDPLTETPEPAAPGLYVHVPFCSRICPYCDFAVTPLGGPGSERLDRYRHALLTELELRAAALGADTVYFGGGTPSLAPAGFFREVALAAVERGLASPSPFIFLEANPEDLVHDPELARQWAAEEIWGVSLGVQALDESRLRFLGRAHNASDAAVAVSRLAEAGIPWISVDLIYGTAGQTPESLREELRAMVALPGVNHISAYELSIEPGTPFGRRQAGGETLTARSEDGSALFRAVHETLAENGFVAYEACNFASAPEFRSRHNRKYWSLVEYLGVGPSAHSFAPERGERFWNRRAFEDWEEAILRGEEPTAERETLRPYERALEEVFLRLRTTDGLPLGGFSARYGEAVVRANRRLFGKWRARGLVELRGDEMTGCLRPTREGLAVADALAREMNLDALTADRDAA